jgi:crossover junction endodeoxyribonuclease RuvC
MRSSLKLAELRGALIAYFKYNGCEVIHQPPKEIRKRFGLKGNATKEEVSKEVLKYYPYLEYDIGPYSDKPNKRKTSDIYDAIATGLSYVLNLKE